jgi:hypothetical protein
MECDFGSRSAAYRKGIKFIIDIADYENFIKNYSFKLNPKGYVQYSSTKDGLHNKYLHRVIMGDPDGKMIDHKNVNPLDNRRENLRVCTNQQNLCNTNKYKNNKSGFKGVSFDKRRQKFAATIGVNGKNKYLGLFITAEAAHECYKKAAVKYHGEFAHF